MTAEGARQNIPQGQLSGDRANMIAWLKVIGPLIYGQLYLQGSAVGLPAAPFFLNVLLTVAALCIGAAEILQPRERPSRVWKQLKKWELLWASSLIGGMILGWLYNIWLVKF